MTTVEIELPPKLLPVFDGKTRYRGAYGGRGSAKTRSFALMTAIWGYNLGMSGESGQILCAREFMNSLDESSMEEIKTAIRDTPWLAAYYEIGEKYIRSNDGSIRYTFAGLRHNLDSIKSKARILLCWVDEAENVSEEAWRKLVPTIRENDSEIWLTWNPESKRSATNERFRVNPPAGAKIVQLNWRDNPWFPDVLNQERLNDMANRPHIYPHIWEGEYADAVEGSYYADYLRKAKDEGRIGRVGRDTLLPVRAFWDIGGTGTLSDACSIWVGQFVGASEIRVIDHYTAQGQELSDHVSWLRSKGYDGCTCVLPHDGSTKDKVFRVSYETYLQQAGFPVIVVPNQGTGAAKMRIEAARRLFPSMWFNEDTTAGGREALGWYHEKRREDGYGLGPEHDWSSHDADAFGLMAVAHSIHRPPSARSTPRKRATGWAA